MNDGLHVSWLPSYGPEMRGGTANCSVIISDKRIGSPVVQASDVLIAMNGPSLDAFEKDVVPGGLIIVNTSIIDRKTTRNDVRTVYVPLTQMASDRGVKAAANTVSVGVLLANEKLFGTERVEEVLRTSLKKKSALEVNLQLLKAGFEFKA